MNEMAFALSLLSTYQQSLIIHTRIVSLIQESEGTHRLHIYLPFRIVLTPIDQFAVELVNDYVLLSHIHSDLFLPFEVMNIDLVSDKLERSIFKRKHLEIPKC